MKAACTIQRASGGGWIARHFSAEFGNVEMTAATEEEALNKLRKELQYRIEWCPCSGASGDTVEIEVSQDRTQRPT